MEPLAVLAVALGAAILLVVAFDVLVTILHPAARGPLGRAASRGTWHVSQRLARGRPERRVLSFAGPVAIVGTLVTWLTLAWVAFALVYLPFLPDGVAAAPGVPVDGQLIEALYFSGTSLSTVGFGDIVATNDVLRLVTVVESISGLVLVTASITYLLSVNPYLLDVRRSAMQLSHLGAVDVPGAVRLASAGGIDEIARVHTASR